MAEYQFHEVANIFPMMTPEEFEQLKEDIREHGLREPIWLHEGKIVDGRNRYLACKEVGRLPVFRQWEGGGEEALLKFVRSLNLIRRHLEGWQIIEVIGKEREYRKKQAAKRQAGGQGGILLPLHGAEAKREEWVEGAAKDYGVSAATIKRGMKILDNATPEVVEALREEKISIRAAADIVELPKAEQREIVARGEEEILKAAKQIRAEKAEKRREERIELIASNPQLPTDKFRVIYADPPWSYGNNGMVGSYGHAESHYPTMEIADLCEMPVKDMADENAVLFLWVTSPLLEDSFKVINAWGFKYKSSFVWDKVKHNFGYYSSVRHEFLLVCTRGSCTPDIKELHDSVVEIERTDKHSQKPAYFRELIGRLYPYGRRIELFAREQVENWETWGNEVCQ